MEKRTRAYRRYMKWVKFKRRVDKYTQGTYSWDTARGLEWKEKILKGESCTWLKTTGKTCNCYMCSDYYKYRKDRAKFNREAQKEIEEELNNK
jgi:hypothetical protein